ncbi:Protein of uncharacterised function (DUF732) [Mycobacteroides abscessus subsp. massiliense]|nr:Protein of uncharacterised function (DUF732) [Mycobacteroides abscessus subsp. massiliense]
MVGIAFLSLVSVTTPAVRADDTDTEFVRQLNDAGIHTTGTKTGIGNDGRYICNALKMGYSQTSVQYYVESQYPGYSEANARRFMNIATSTYCPNL